MANNKNTNNKVGSRKPNPNAKPSQSKKKKESRTIAWLVGGIGVLAVLIVIMAVAMIRQGNSSSTAEASVLPPIDGIGCNTMEQSIFHIHSHLTILDNGQNVEVPANIGIYPANTCLYWLHTHDATGEIHMEAPKAQSFTLGNFFDIWKQPLSKTEVAGHSDNGKEIKVFVDGKEYTGDPRAIELQAHTKIVLEVGPKFVTPPPDTYQFPKGD